MSFRFANNLFLKTLHVFFDRSMQPVVPNPCKNNQCDQLCLLAPMVAEGFVCKCRPGNRLVDGKTCVEKDNPYLMVVKSTQIVDLSVMPEDAANGHLTPIVDLKIGKSVDYDTSKQTIYWTETEKDTDVNGTLYMSHIGGGDKINFFDEYDTGMVGSPFAIAFDWVGRNMYIANQESSSIELVRVDGKKKNRMVILTNDGTKEGIGKPVSIALDPQNGLLYWLDQGGAGVPAKIGKAGMDGSNPSVLVSDGLTRPEFLAIDPDTDMLYFSSSSPAKVRWWRVICRCTNQGLV